MYLGGVVGIAAGTRENGIPVLKVILPFYLLMIITQLFQTVVVDIVKEKVFLSTWGGWYTHSLVVLLLVVCCEICERML